MVRAKPTAIFCHDQREVPVITRMSVRNFKALRQVEVDLSPFTVLIGPNDAGKTSFLEAVYALSESTRSHLPSCFWSPWQFRELVYNNSADTNVEFTAELEPAIGIDHAERQTESHLTYSLAIAFMQNHSCVERAEMVQSAGAPPIALMHGRETPNTSVFRLKNGANIGGDEG